MDARAGAGLGVGFADGRLEPVTPPRPSLPDHLIAAEGAPVRRLPIGAELQPGGGVDFRLWAPRCRKVVVEIEGLEPETLQAETGGYFSL